MSRTSEPEVKKILFISLSCVGDVIMTTPIIQSLHNKYPDAIIDFVADKRSSKLYSCCPYLGKIFHKDKNKLLRGSIALLRQLWGNYYDLIVDVRTDGLTQLIRGNTKLTKRKSRPYGLHSVEHLMGVIREIHGDKSIPESCVWFRDEEEQYASDRLSSLPGNKWLALGLGSAGGRERKTWPEEKYIELANSLKHEFSGIILAGGPAEHEQAMTVAAKLEVPYLDATDTDLLQISAILKHASIFVGSDSGLGHIAAAVSVPTLTFFSVDHPERCLPWGGKGEWLMAGNGFVHEIPVVDVEQKVCSMLTA